MSQPNVSYRPCPFYVQPRGTTKVRDRIYCEGPVGHVGTHCGDRDRSEYLRLLRVTR